MVDRQSEVRRAVDAVGGRRHRLDRDEGVVPRREQEGRAGHVLGVRERSVAEEGE
ncbi:hypothetical protein ACFQL0_14980 [Haloplanus litoreus]|uniref:hypothetical protein n=1 Tax=Haloplanus litoreus TaxID=767515 RepID=UPI00360656EA